PTGLGVLVAVDGLVDAGAHDAGEALHGGVVGEALVGAVQLLVALVAGAGAQHVPDGGAQQELPHVVLPGSCVPRPSMVPPRWSGGTRRSPMGRFSAAAGRARPVLTRAGDPTRVASVSVRKCWIVCESPDERTTCSPSPASRWAATTTPSNGTPPSGARTWR